MNRDEKSKDGGTALMDESHVPDQELIFPEVETGGQTAAHEQGAATTPTPEELQALFEREATSQAATATTVAGNQVSPASTEKADSNERRLLSILGVLLLVALGITFYFYRQTRPKPVPAPKSVDLTSTGTETTTTGMPETAFRISPEKQQLIGVQYGTVENQTISKSLRAVGKAAFDETRIVRINPKVEGWIETVYVDFTGKLVQKGQPLLTIYSPDLVQTQEEYLLAIKGRKQIGESPFGEAVNFSESLVQSARWFPSRRFPWL